MLRYMNTLSMVCAWLALFELIHIFWNMYMHSKKERPAILNESAPTEAPSNNYVEGIQSTSDQAPLLPEKVPLPSPPAQSNELTIVSFPRTFAWQSSLLRMGTCHGYLFTANGWICCANLFGWGRLGGGVAFSKKERIVPCLVALSAWTHTWAS